MNELHAEGRLPRELRPPKPSAHPEFHLHPVLQQEYVSAVPTVPRHKPHSSGTRGLLLTAERPRDAISNAFALAGDVFHELDDKACF